MSGGAGTDPIDRSWHLGAAAVRAQGLAPGPHVVATPIGNLGDITIRGLSALAAADAILAEDTRVTRRLLERYGIRTPLRRFDAHAGEAKIAAALREMRHGAALALVSDAGTPLLSDPGASLVMRAAAEGIAVFPLPGPSALLAALVAGGVPADRFYFEGFLPPKAGDRRRRLRELSAVPGALVFYEAPHRVRETLADMADILGNRAAVAARELTKLHESFSRGSLRELAERFADEEPRGEFVLLAGAPGEEVAAGPAAVDARLAVLAATMSVKDAAAAVAAAEFGLPKREVYARALLLGKGDAAQVGEDRRRSLANLAGGDAERLALLLLVCKGYWPLARRYLSPAGEIDIVARRGRTIVAVEVRNRPTLDAAATSVTPAKVARIAAAFRQFRAERRLGGDLTFRLDAILVAPGRWPRHVVNLGDLD